MEMDFRKKIYFWFLSLENYRDSLSNYKDKNGLIVLPYFIFESIQFLLLSIVYYIIRFFMLVYQFLSYLLFESYNLITRLPNAFKSKKKIKRANSGHIEDKHRRLQLFLDLDNTLIYSSLSKLDCYKNFCKLNNSFYVYKRPHLDNFLNTASQFCDITIYTASIKEYADMVIDYIDKNRHITKRLYRSDCININKSWFKDVSRFVKPDDLHNIIVIDDVPHCHLTLKNNVIAIKSWSAEDVNDDSLHKIRNIFQNYRGNLNVSEIISTSIVCEV